MSTEHWWLAFTGARVAALFLCAGIGWLILATEFRPARWIFRLGGGTFVAFGLFALLKTMELVSPDMCPEWANGGWLGWVIYYGTGCWIPM